MVHISRTMMLADPLRKGLPPKIFNDEFNGKPLLILDEGHNITNFHYV
jgi:hypothetical protein